MPACAETGCTCRTGSGQKHGRRFYSFPLKKPDLLKKWLANMERTSFVPTKSSRLCSAHFLDSCYKEDLYAKYMGVAEGEKRLRLLKEDAVPTEFEQSKGKAPKKRASAVSRRGKQERERIIQEVFILFLSSRTCVSLSRSIRVRTARLVSSYKCALPLRTE